MGEIRDTASRRSIVLGRTGAGKSALLLELAHNEDNVIVIDPSEFAFRFIENSTILQFFQAAGVNLDLFYRLLWRHVLVVELLKRRFRLTHPNDSLGFIDQVNQWVRFNPGRKAAMDYLRNWGEKFWETTEVRTRELTRKFEDELTANLKLGGELLQLGANGASRLGTQEREEIVSRGNEVVSAIQVRELREVISLLGEKVFNDERAKYYVVIDKLDENWARVQTRYRLIRALIEEIRSFRELRNVKILAAIRYDLLLEVIDETREAGFQEEKYQDYFLDIRWGMSDLEELINLRIAKLYRRRYQAATLVKFADVFPTVKRGRPDPLRYILQRTLMRPRDAIAFVNECFRLAENRERVSWKVIRAAEGTFSDRRIKALCTEWRAHYPSLDVLIELLRDLPSRFGRSDLTPRLESVIVRCAAMQESDPCITISKEMLDPSSKSSDRNFLDEALRILYKVGILGARFAKNEPISWAFSHEDEIGRGEVRRAISFHVHKMGWRGLGTRVLDDEDELHGLEDDE